MKVRIAAVFLTLGLMAASTGALAQHFGEFIVGGGWSAQPHGPAAASLPPERASEYAPLAANLSKLLPTGTDLRSAASGFRSLGEFIAALHVSKNLQIGFADLKERIVSGHSLGTAIAALRPDTDSEIEARRGRAAAREELARV